jgi:WD40 repeat protein
MTINAAAISSDGLLSLIAEPEQVCLWENQQHQKTMPCITGGEAEHVELVGISKSKQYFFTSNQMTVRLYQLQTNKKARLINEWYADNNIINDIAISANGETLLLGYRNGQAGIIETKVADKKVFQLHRLDINAVALSDDGKMAFTGSSDKTAVLWRTSNGESVSVYQHRTRVNHVDISEDGRLGFTIDSINDRAFWQLDNKNAPELSELQTSLKFLEINHSAFSDDQKLFLTGSPKQKIMLWRVSDGELIGQWQSAKIGRSSVLQVTFAAKDRIAIITSDGNYQEFLLSEQR